MKEFNWTYVIVGVVFGYLMYLSNINFIIAIILGLGVALGGNSSYLFLKNNLTND